MKYEDIAKGCWSFLAFSELRKERPFHAKNVTKAFWNWRRENNPFYEKWWLMRFAVFCCCCWAQSHSFQWHYRERSMHLEIRYLGCVSVLPFIQFSIIWSFCTGLYLFVDICLCFIDTSDTRWDNSKFSLLILHQ